MTRRDWLGLALLAIVLLAWPLHTPRITTRGEAREAMVVRDMLREGHWVIGYRQGVIASKPPMHHWLALGPAALVGPTDAAVRFPAALGAVVLAGMTMRMGALAGGRAVGWLAAGALAGTQTFWRSALEARVDMVFAAAVATALVGFIAWCGGPRRRPPFVVYAALVAAVLTKGPAGVVVPALVIAAFVAWRREPALLRAAWSWPAGLLSTAVVLGWYVLAYRVGGRHFVAVQLLRENVERMVGSGAFARRGARRLARTKLLVSFLGKLFPWNLALIEAGRRWRREGLPPAEGFLQLWWIGVLGVFSLAAGERTVYLLPLYPPVAVTAALWLARTAGPRGRMALVLATLVCADAVALGSVHADRMRLARREAPFVEFAGTVQRLVPPGTPLTASRGVDEDDYVTLGWLLDRPFMRAGKIECPAGTFRIDMEGGSPTDHRETLARVRRRGRVVVLQRCGQP